MSQFERDLTGGSVTRQLIRFSMPFLFSNFIQALYNVADMLIVSWFAGTNDLAGVSNGGQLTFVVTNFVVGLTVGGTVLIGQYYGAKRREDIRTTIGTLFSVLLIAALLMTVVIITLSGPILGLINTPPEAFAPAQTYLNICMGGTVFIFGYNAVSAILRGMGDSIRPLIFVGIAAGINVLLDLLMVGPMGMGAAGAAIATIISQAISLILSVIYLARSNFLFDFHLRSFRIDRDKLARLLKVGLPSSVQNVIVGISFLVMTTLVNGYGVAATAATGIVGKFNSFAILPPIAMSASVSSMAAQNLGANLPERAIKTMRAGIRIALPICFVFFLVSFFAPQAVLSVFSDDAAVLQRGLEYIRFFSVDYLLVPFLFCINGLFTGAGHTTFTMLSSMLSSVLLRVPIAILMGSTMGLGMTGIGMAAPVASFGALIVSTIYLKTGRWRESRITALPIEES